MGTKGFSRFRLMPLVTILLLFLAAIADGATVSGTVTNNSGTSGRIYLSVLGIGGGYGVSIDPAVTTSYAIDGIQDNGPYIIQAFQDTINSGSQHANDPASFPVPFTVTGGADVTNLDVTLNSPPPVPLQPPKSASVVSGDNGVLINWEPATTLTGVEIATAYQVYWSTSPNPGPLNTTGGGSSTLIPSNDKNAYIKALTNGANYYFAVTSWLNGAESTTVNANNGALITVGAPAGGVTVSGTVTITGATPGATPLYFALGTGNGPPAYIGYVANPAASQAYTLSGVQPGNYRIYAILDMNNNGIIDLGDIDNTSGNGVPITVGSTNLTNANVTLVAVDAQISLWTNHWKQNANEGYGLYINVMAGQKRPVNVSVTGPQLTGAINLGLINQGGFSLWPILAARPTLSPADTYQFTLAYSDGTNSSTPLTAPVTGVVDSFATPVSPLGFIPYPFTPTDFTWSAPAAPPATYTYAFWISVQGFSDDGYFGMPSSTTKVSYPYAYVDGTSYDWSIAVLDSFNNSAQFQANFTPTTAPYIISFLPLSGVPGTQVTITGGNFGATVSENLVSFNGLPATIISASSSSLLVTVPNGATSGTIMVSNLTSVKSGSSMEQFVIIPPPITVASPLGGPKVQPVDVFLTANEPATIYYTTNGIDPDTSSPSFTDSVGNVAQGPIHIATTTTLKYFAKGLAGNIEAIKQQVYSFGAPTTTSLLVTGQPGVYSGTTSTLNLTATVSASTIADGLVNFMLDGTIIAAAVPVNDGVALATYTTVITGGAHTVVASYLGTDKLAPSVAEVIISVSKAAASVTLGGLNKTYSGSPQGATATTIPPGLAVIFTYDGLATVPTNVGNYTVVAAINDINYHGVTSDTLVIGKATATITLGGLTKTYTGSPQAATATTTPPGLTVSFTYDGLATVPVIVGNYIVVGTINDNNYQGTASGTMVISKAEQNIAFGPLPVKVYGDGPFNLGATASSGLAVSYASSNPAVATISGSTVTVLQAGTTTITASQTGDANYNAALNVQRVLTVIQPIKFSTDVTSVTTVPVTLVYPGAMQMQFLIDNGTSWTKLEPFVATRSIKLPSGNGLKSVSVRFIDGQSTPSPIYSASIFVDTIAPVGTISINGGAAATDSTNLTLNLNADDSGVGDLQMRFSEDGKSWTDSSWQPYATTYSYALGTVPVATVSPGTKKVYVQFKDAGGKLSKSSFDTINYVTQIVDAGTKTSITINNGNTFTNSTAVTLTLVAPAGNSYVRLSNDGSKWGKWMPVPATTLAWKLTRGDGLKTIYAQYSADQVTPSATYSADITLDTIAPTGWLLINDGTPVTGSASVNLTMGASDINGIAGMCISETTTACSSSAFEPFAASKNDYLIKSPGDGKKNIYISYKDNAGKISKPIKAVITLDTTAPNGSVVINGGKSSTTIPEVSLKLKADKAVYMQLATDGSTWGEWEAYATSRNVTLPSGAGIKKVQVKFKDFAGNESQAFFDEIELL